jgi:formate dehydrogenase subunit gamma
MAERDTHPALLLRHGTRDRVLHWTVVIAFLFAAASGLSLFHPSLFWLTSLTGGGPWTTILHPFIGLFMVATFLWFAGPKFRVNQLTPDDVTWLKKFRYVFSGEEDKLPEVGEYNAGQKVLYLALMACVLLLALTGFLIWRRYFAGNFPVRVVRLGALVHAFVAFVLILSIVVHVSAAVWERGSITSMIRGTVTPGWAYKYRRAWFRQMIR